jgi:hypothetical protein
MTLQPGVSQGKAMIEEAKKLGVPADDLLTADGREVAWTPTTDFRITINGVLVELRKGEPIRDSYRINELRNMRCPVVSQESELWRRVTAAQASKTRPEMVALKPTYWGMGIDLMEAGRRVRSWCHRRRKPS